MRPVLLRKLLALVPVVIAVSLLTFGLLLLLPGDPAVAILGPEAQPASLAALRENLGLDEPFLVRYFDWLSGIAQGDLGRAYKTNQPVTEAIGQRLPVTVELIVLSQVLALLVAVPAGMVAAYRAGSRVDRALTITSFTLIAIPEFVLALVFIFVFAVKLQWFPAAGYTPLTDDLLENLRSVVLPVVALAAGSLAVYQRLLRTEMITTLEEDFIMVARSKGLSVRQVLVRHALRPSVLSLVTVVGLTLGNLIGGALVVEVIFGLPGMGRLLYDAIFAREYVVVQSVVGFIAVSYVLINFVVDAAYSLLDPRVRRV